MSGITLQEVGGSLVIKVPEEQTLIGRGQFLQVTDKRVSRSHALLDVSDRKLYITPTHTNPCFLKRHGSKDHAMMAKDVKTILNHGDAFGLLPDQFFYLVSYPQLNGNKETAVRVEENKQKQKEEIISKEQPREKSPLPDKTSGDASDEDAEKGPLEEKLKEDVSDEAEEKEEAKDESIEEKEGDENEEVETPAGNMALPLDKKRPLPEWMHKVSDSSPSKPKASPKKVKVAAVSKREPGEKLTTAKEDADHKEEQKGDEEEEAEEEVEEEEEDDDEKLPRKTGVAAAAKDSDEEEEFEEEISDDDYVPEALPKAEKSRKKRKQDSDSEEEEEFSDDDDDDDYAPNKKKPKTPKKAPKGRGKKAAAKGRQTPSRSAKKATPRGRRKHYSEDEEEEDVVLPRRRGARNDDDSPSRRPQRAARQKRGSYVDDPMIEEALEDFASEGSVEGANADKDSDFDVNEAVDSGSDWEKKGKKQRVPPKSPKVTRAPRPSSKRGKKKSPRRQSKSKTFSDDDDEEDDLEDDEPYVPRPSKRRGGAASQESGESDDDKKKRRRREPCQYGKKCYRKNPVHFRTYCHPGDSSYDEEDKDTPAPKDNSKKTKDVSRASPEKPSRPQRSTAGTRLVTQGTADDDLPDTYDYNDSFIDDGTQETDDSGKDSDYNAGQDARTTTKEAKKVLKNKKITATDEEED